MILDFLEKHNNVISPLVGIGVFTATFTMGLPFLWAALSGALLGERHKKTTIRCKICSLEVLKIKREQHV